MSTFEQDLAYVDSLSNEDKVNLMESLKDKQPPLVTHPGPQTTAAESEADLTLYGGAAGGGKTFLAVLLALTKHKRSLIIRKEAAQLYAMQDEIEGIMGSRDGFNSQNGIWRLPNTAITDPYQEEPNRQIRFGGLNKPGDAAKYQGAPRDLLVIDEAANISYEEFVYLTVWERTVVAGQRTRTLLCSNPPTDATGMWMVRIFRPWLDPDHPDPAKDGELRWFLVVEDDDVEVKGAGDYEIDGQTYSAQSRTFIGAKVDDNPHMIQSGYKQKLQRLPKYLRERMLEGKFLASLADHERQAIPTAWVEAAMKRWNPGKAVNRMTSIGVDPSRGGADEMVISPKHGNWYAPLIKIPGKDVPTGPLGAAEVVIARRDSCPINMDVIGIGSSVYDKLIENDIDVEALVSNQATDEISKDGLFGFKNLRALLWWRMREALDPESGDKLEIPPDPKLKADLCGFKYTDIPGKPLPLIQIESKTEFKARMGRSNDAGDGVIYANYRSASLSDLRKGGKRFKVKLCIGERR